MRNVILALGLLLATPVGAADWLLFCRANNPVTALKPGEWACNQPTSINNDSPSLGLALCENASVRYFTDRNGDATASSATVSIRSCPSETADADACWILENIALDGVASTNTEAIYGFDAEWIYADMLNVGTINDPQINIRCSLPRS